MRNKICYVFLGLLMSFSFMNNVFATDDFSFSVTANVVGGETTVAKGSEVAVNLALNSDVDISSCTFEITYDSGIEIAATPSGMNNYIVEVDGSKVFINRSVTDTEFVSGQNVLQLKYKINDDGEVIIKTLDCTSSVDNKTGSYDNISLAFKVSEEDDTTLSSLSVTGGVLSPSFSSSIKQYNIKLDSSKFSLNMTTSSNEYQNKIVVTDANGNKLDYSDITFSDLSGQALMKLIVAINGVEEYTLLASYEQKELDNTLASLKVYGKEIELEDGKYDYTITVSSDVSSVKIEATLNDNTNFQFSDNNGPTTFQTPYSSNTYPLIIEPKDSSLGVENATYTITVIKEGSTVSSLSSSKSQENTTANPTTGGVSMVVIVFILFVSLIGSIALYRKNLEVLDNK